VFERGIVQGFLLGLEICRGWCWARSGGAGGLASGRLASRAGEPQARWDLVGRDVLVDMLLAVFGFWGC
jgi:hypothetical protein